MLRQRFSRAALVTVVLSLVVGGCGSSDDGGEGAQSDTTTTTEAPVRGGTVVAAIESDPGGLNPAVTTSGGTHTASQLMYSGLVELDEKSNPKGELAEKWTIEDNGSTYRFTLRSGVKWHDGKPFTAADVKYSFDEVLLKYHSRTKASVGSALQSIEAPDDLTVVFKFKQPYAPFLQQLDVTEAPMVPKHVFEGSDPTQNPANQAPIGTGPFKFVSYTKGSEVRLERNPDYFKKGLPYLDAVVMRVIPDRASQVTALEAGEVDWLYGVPGPDLARLKDAGYKTLQTGINPGGSNCIMTVSFNLERPMFSDVKTRTGIARAVDREKFLERVLFGEGKVAEAPISSGIPFAHADDLDMPTFDKAAAEKLLEEAGWKREGAGTRTASGVEGVPDGTPFAFSFTHFPSFNQYAELLVAQLKEVGIEVKSEPLEPPVFADTVFTKRAFDTNVISYCNGLDPEIGVRRMYISSNIGPIPFSNAAAYRNEKIDSLFDEAQATVDRAERSKVYREIQEIVVKDLPYFWLVETLSTRVYDAKCQGFGPSGHFAETASCRE